MAQREKTFGQIAYEGFLRYVKERPNIAAARVSWDELSAGEKNAWDVAGQAVLDEVRERFDF